MRQTKAFVVLIRYRKRGQPVVDGVYQSRWAAYFRVRYIRLDMFPKEVWCVYQEVPLYLEGGTTTAYEKTRQAAETDETAGDPT